MAKDTEAGKVRCHVCNKVKSEKDMASPVVCKDCAKK